MNCDSLDCHAAVHRENRMKKLMTILLALSFLGTTIAVGFAQDTKLGEGTQKKKKNPPKKNKNLKKKTAQK
jgi:preprotein translocase subunit SecG